MEREEEIFYNLSIFKINVNAMEDGRGIILLTNNNNGFQNHITLLEKREKKYFHTFRK